MFWKAVSYLPTLLPRSNCLGQVSSPLPLSKGGIWSDLVNKDPLINNTVNFMKEARGFYLVVELSLRTRVQKEACRGKGTGTRATTEKKKTTNTRYSTRENKGWPRPSLCSHSTWPGASIMCRNHATRTGDPAIAEAHHGTLPLKSLPKAACP